MHILICMLLSFAMAKYKVELISKASKPSMSYINAKGDGYSPCKYIFNPAWLPVSAGLNRTALLLRAALCPTEYGGKEDHIMFAYCDDTGKCDDLQPVSFPFEKNAQDPRVVFYKGWYYLYYYANGDNLKTVYLRKSQTPLDPKSWTRVGGPLPWHRNGCVLLRDQGPHYVIFGEAPHPLPALGIATTQDFEKYNIVNASWIFALGANNTEEPEVVVEASTPVATLSTGDYIHLYSAGTPGWVPNGNYTGGWVILDKDDPSIIKQRSTKHLLVSSVDYEIGDGPYPVQRHRTIFVTSIVPTGNTDEFRVWYGAADANVGTAIIRVTII